MRRDLEESFGWSLACPGRTEGQLRPEFSDLERHLSRAAAHFFPVEDGYAVTSRPVEGPIDGLRIRVARGDFRAEFGLECYRWGAAALPQLVAASGDATPEDAEPARSPTRALAVRLVGRAGSHTIDQVAGYGRQLAELLRWVGAGVGAGALVALFSFLIANPPRYMVDALATVSALMLVVIIYFVMSASMSVGTWVGERLAEALRSRAALSARGDEGLCDDLERYRCLSRGLIHQRALIGGELRRLPFRFERRGWDDAPSSSG